MKNNIKLLCLMGVAVLTFSGCGKKEEQTQEVAAIDNVAQTGIDEEEAMKVADDTSEDVSSFFDGTDDKMNSDTSPSEEKFVPMEEEELLEEELLEEELLEEELPEEEVSEESLDSDAAESDTEETDSSEDEEGPVVLDVSSELSGLHHVEMVLKDYGTIEIELDADVAPITVTNFIKLVQEGFYDGLTFHRIIPGFIVQGGDPDKNGTGGSKDTIKGEFASNGIENSISHEKGVISMARTSLPDSASSQFFIMLDDKSDILDGEYAAFGKVTSGMEYVEAMANDAETVDDNGTVPEEKQPVLEKAIVLD